MAIGEWMTTKEVAEFLGVTDGRVRQFVIEGRLHPEKLFGHLLAFHRSKIEEFANRERKVGRPKTRDRAS